MKTSQVLLGLLTILLLPLASNAFAHGVAPKGYATDSDGHVVKNNYNECWRTSSWTPELAIAECDPDLMKKEVPVVAKPVVMPAPAPTLVAVTISLDGANFATSSAKLLKGSDVKLNEVLKAAKQHPEANFAVSGHTDSRGNQANNQKLSEKRAASVKSWLVAHGVTAGRINTAGYADAQPIGDNKTAAGRAANRRVDVHYVIQK